MLTIDRGQKKEVRARVRLRQHSSTDHLCRECFARAEAGAEGPATAGARLGSGLTLGGVVSGGLVADGDDDGVQDGAHASGDGHVEGKGEVGIITIDSKVVRFAHEHHAPEETEHAYSNRSVTSFARFCLK